MIQAQPRNERRVSGAGWKPVTFSSLIAAPIAGGVVAVSAQLSPWAGIGGVVGIFVLIAMFISPTASLMAVSASLPLERIGRVTEDFSSFTISLSRIVGLLSLGALLVHVLLLRRKLVFGLALWMYAGYTAIALCGIGWALQPSDAIRDSQRIIGNLLFFFLIINLITKFSLVRLGIMTWLLASAGSSIYGIYQYHFGSTIAENQMGSTTQRFTGVVEDDAETSTLGAKVKRAYGTTSHPGLFGLNLTMTIPFFGWIMRGQPGYRKAFWFALLCVCCYGIAISNTRFTFIIAGVILLITLVRGLWQFQPITHVAIVAAGIAAFPFIPSDIYMRAFDPSLYSADKSNAIRIRFKMLDKSLDILSDHWVLGIGVGNQDIVPAMITDEQGGRITPDGLKASAHNEFVWTAVEVGVFGWLLHWGFVALIVASAFRAGAKLKRIASEQDQYWFLVAAQTMLLCVPFYGVQSEVFHYPLKGWWFVAGIVWVIWTGVRRLPVQTPRPMEVAA
ncbi:MAG: O-antigen ligase family protein [Acidobacteria bacterium]|nr:O-antigen ligase family protein [Acidobacteriota bacterium]